MILRFLKTNQAYHFVTIPLLVLILWFRAYLNPESFDFFAGEDQMLLFRPFAAVVKWSPLVANLLLIGQVLILTFFITRLNSVFSFIRQRTFLPSNLFVLILGGVVSMHGLHPVYFAAMFLLLSINRIFGAYEIKKPNSNAFDAGFLIGLGSLFYLNLIFYFPIVWIGFVLIRKNPGWRNFILPLLGLSIPWLYAFSYYFFTDTLADFGQTIQQNIFTSNNFLQGNLNFQIYLGLLILLTLIGSTFLIARIDEKKVSTRKYFQIFFIVFIISMAILLAVPAVSQEILVIMAIPLVFLFSNYLIFMRMQLWANVFVYLLLAMVIYMQFG
ncbi:DUF6427 family protein [Mangrovibacterium marinum]|uniref:Beta-carotene 15,15'-monooxygenase n=1 Tax=Mangrovibacterium marinum TaxID=1639118 RepID=A0A2T5C6N0_9BACT|nr:DUF6427 family protein [Mangrovibacterium marinum]PTN10613.1 hypothetical protein C8N47_101263 [Mangrovibacterium marinum]